MKPTTPLSPILLAVMAVLLQAPLAILQAQQDAADPRQVTIALLAEAVVDDTIVTLDQIAKLSGGSPALRKRLGKLDIADFPASASHRIVASDQVRFRLLLADIEVAEFRLSGAKRTTIVESDDPVTLRKLIAAAEYAARTRYPGNAALATMTAGKGIEVPAFEAHPLDRVRLDASVNGPVPLSGRIRVEVALTVNGKKREVVPVFLEITQRDTSANVARNAEQPIRPVANWTPAGGAADVLIKARDNVKIVAVIGAARVEAIGEAQQDGRIGQVIRVRNIESNRIVHGRVEASGIVAVDY
jgi:flagellar basal body P-ring formation protein FlgA